MKSSSYEIDCLTSAATLGMRLPPPLVRRRLLKGAKFSSTPFRSSPLCMEENRKHRDGCNGAEKETECTGAVLGIRFYERKEGGAGLANAEISAKRVSLSLVFTDSMDMKNSEQL